MFWRKGKKRTAVKKIEGPLWGYMVSEHRVIVDVLGKLRQLQRHERVVGGKEVILIRIFDPAAADKKSVTIEDYESLDDHPELILYEGYCGESGGRLNIHIGKK